ncbi:MAG TPA: EAL domain-containing protein [Thermoanaerobaculia bacterium]|nr:EAL domain-containing protein [Thermoanaerobaculia bacterium]
MLEENALAGHPPVAPAPQRFQIVGGGLAPAHLPATMPGAIALGEGGDPDALARLVPLVVEHSPEGIILIEPSHDDRGPRILYANQSFCRMTGAERSEVTGQQLEIFQDEESDRAVRDALLHPLCQRKPVEGEAVAFRRNGSRYSVELLLVPIHDAHGEVAFWIAYLRDISERKAQLAALQQQALHDVLTQLPNRTLLLDRMEQAVLVGRRTNAPLALMIMDLDGFKEVNDSLGHHFGDLLLQQVARRLRSETSESDTVARLGGDEFAFVLPAVGDARVATRVARRILKALEKPFILEEQKCEVGASIGIAIFPEHGTDAATLMRHADTAMYFAKRKGRGCSVYTSELDPHSPVSLTLGVELREAIEQNQLVLYYQPKIHLQTGVVTRAEALVRWNHPQRGLLPPDQFIPLAERTGLIKPLTDWVLDNALRQCRIWQDAGLPLHVAVNVSSKTLQEHSLPQIVASYLEKWRVEPRALKLEITESSIMADPPHVFAILSLLQTLGVRLSLDDFGTGFSSLMHLRQLPVDEIKIDKSFVMGMASSAGDRAIVRATIDLAHNLGRQVVAEGVDDDETCRLLASLGCDMAQGYSFTPPLPCAAFEEWLEVTGWGFTVWRDLILSPRSARSLA